MASVEYVMTRHDHPQDLANGRTVGVGETIRLSEQEVKDNKWLLDEGILVQKQEGGEKK